MKSYRESNTESSFCKAAGSGAAVSLPSAPSAARPHFMMAGSACRQGG